MCEKNYVWNPSKHACEIDIYLTRIFGDSVVICDEIRQVTKNIPTKTVPTKTISTKNYFKKFYQKKGKL